MSEVQGVAQAQEVAAQEYELCSAEEAFYLDWGRETVKQAIPNAAAALQRVLTIAAGLIGGIVALVKEDVITAPCRSAVLILLLFALAASGVGLFPVKGDYREDSSAAMHEFKRRSLAFKLVLLWASYAFLFAALATAVGGVVWLANNRPAT